MTLTLEWKFTHKVLCIPKEDQESLSAPSLDCLCKAWASSWSCSFNPNRTGNLSLLLLWFVSAQQAPLPVPANHSQTRPGISLCSLPILSLPGRGLFPVSWHNADTGLLHLILVL